MNMFKSCRACTERTLGCHSKCEKYLKERAELAKMKAHENANAEYRSYRNSNMSKIMGAKAIERQKKRNYTGMGGN